MSVRLYLTIAAIVAILYALAFLIIPIQASLFFSSFAEARAVLYLRFCGAAVLAWGLIVWFAKDFQGWRAVRSVLISSDGGPHRQHHHNNLGHPGREWLNANAWGSAIVLALRFLLAHGLSAEVLPLAIVRA